MQSKFGIWLQAARPNTLGAAFSPVLIGTVIALGDGKFHWLAALAALLGALCIQIGTNLANDYFDYKKGADTKDRVGPQRVTQSGLVKPYEIRNATLIVFTAAFIIGIYLVYRGGWPVVIIGLISLLLGVIYTGGPFPLAYHGLGEIFAFLFFGPIASATTYFVQALSWSTLSIVAGLAPGFFAVALLSINNLRDLEEDRQTGKHTLVAVLGKSFGQWEYIFSTATATLIPIILILVSNSHMGALLASFSFLMSFHAFQITRNYKEAKDLIAVLKMTGKLQIIYSVLFAIGWFL